MKAILIGLSFLLSYPLASAQSTATPVDQFENDKILEKLLEDTFLNKIDIDTPTIAAATQEICNMITRKQSVANEKRIVFAVEVPPIIGESVILKTKYLTAKKLLVLFCQQNGLKYYIEKGVIHIVPDISSETRKKSLAKLTQIQVPAMKFTAEYLPDVLRDILSPHGLTFTIHNHKLKANGERRPLVLEQVRISSFKHKATNLHELLQALANKANLKVWMSDKGITFTQKDIDFKKLIRAQK